MLIPEISQLLQWSILSGDSYHTGPYGYGHRYLKFRPNGHDIKVIFDVGCGEVREIVIFNDVFEPPARWIQPQHRRRHEEHARTQRRRDPAYDELGHVEIAEIDVMIEKMAVLVAHAAYA